MRLQISAEDVMNVLGISGRTAQRRRQEGVLSMEESDRLYRIARVTRRAFEVFGAEDTARGWLKDPSHLFRGAAPLTLLGSDAGAEAVEQELGRIDYGDLY
jgi:putative toxin-antitoxin system antitoxin component (TIGR02293 family)